MKVKLECPTNFLSASELEDILVKYQSSLCSKNPDAVIVNPGTEKYLGWDHFSRYENLKVVGTPSTGTNHIDVLSLRENEISVVCLLDDKDSLENIHASAEFTWVHVMNLARKFSRAINSVDDWRSEENELHLRSNELFGKKIGIVGVGRIGRKILSYAKAFGMSVMFYDPYVEHAKGAIKADRIEELSDCDVITINCVLSNETREMITYGVWDDIKPGTIIVNTSRGEVVNEKYIASLINGKGISYGADVLQGEQNLQKLRTSPIYELSEKENVVITPHVAGATKESQTKALCYTLGLVRNLV